MMIYDVLWRISRLNPLPVITVAEAHRDAQPPPDLDGDSVRFTKWAEGEGMEVFFTNGIAIAKDVVLLAEGLGHYYYRIVIEDADDVELERLLKAREGICTAMRRVAHVVDERPAVPVRDVLQEDGRRADMWADTMNGGLWEVEPTWMARGRARKGGLSS